MNTFSNVSRLVAIAAALAALLIGIGGNPALADDKVTYPSTYEGPQDFEDSCESAGGDVVDGYDSNGFLMWSECQIDGNSVETCDWGWEGDSCTAGGEAPAPDHSSTPIASGVHTGTNSVSAGSTRGGGAHPGTKIVLSSTSRSND